VDLNLVAVFLRVVELKSFTAAAEALGLPKSSVSRSVARLEESLGVQLLRRTTRTVSLTEAGTTYVREASAALAALEDAHATLSQLDRRPQGTVRITAPADLATLVLADIGTRFVQRNPGITLEFLLTTRMVNLVDEGVDLAVRAGPMRDSSLKARRVNGLEARLVAAPSYLEAHPAPTRLTELAQHACVLFRPRRGQTEWALVGPDGPERVEVRGPIGGDDFTFVRAAALAGAGIALVPALLCEQDVARGKLVRVLPAYRTAASPLHVVWPAARQVLHRVSLVRDWLVSSLGSTAEGESDPRAEERVADPSGSRCMGGTSPVTLVHSCRRNPSLVYARW
jgi:DNA-binding transcriptional LysR family regulator